MKIFEWIKDIEKVYEDLIEKAKEESLIEIQTFRKEQEKFLEDSIQTKQNNVKEVLKSLNKETKEEIRIFKEKLESKLKLVKSNYERKMEELIEEIITKAGLNFNV
ncbi:MAG: hypothetical protein ACFE85_03345 [Candidatus Hodarchaeota archaeon]